MKIFVTGSKGFIGSNLVELLLNRGHELTTLDTGFYEDGVLYRDNAAGGTRHLRKDIRNVDVGDLRGHDAVVHLAELSNDPLSEHNEEVTYAINHRGSVRLAHLAKQAGVSRFVYTSSCSVYGVDNGEALKTEQSRLIPQTAYARCKVLVERDVSEIADEAFSPVFLRNATAYGPSPCIRFDIVLNNLMGRAYTSGEIRMTSDGSPWRPLIHVFDICEAISSVLDAPREQVHNEVFNVGATDENYQIRDIGKIVADTVAGCKLFLGTSDGDNRSYRVSFEKIGDRLPDFRCRWTALDGAEQLRDLFQQIDLSEEVFEFRAFTRLEQLKHLIKSEKVDERLFWRHPTTGTVRQDKGESGRFKWRGHAV